MLPTFVPCLVEVVEWLLHLLVQTSECLHILQRTLQMLLVLFKEAVLLDHSCEILKVTVYSFSRVVRALKFSMAAYGSF